MTLFCIPMGPHDVPFAAQPMTRHMNMFIEPVAHSSPSNKPEGAE